MCKSPPLPRLQFTNNMILFCLAPSYLGALTCLHGIHCRSKVDGSLFFSMPKFWVSLKSQQFSQIGGHAPITGISTELPRLIYSRSDDMLFAFSGSGTEETGKRLDGPCTPGALRLVKALVMGTQQRVSPSPLLFRIASCNVTPRKGTVLSYFQIHP